MWRQFSAAHRGITPDSSRRSPFIERTTIGDRGQREEHMYAVRQLERFTISTPYPDIVGRVDSFFVEDWLRNSTLVMAQASLLVDEIMNFKMKPASANSGDSLAARREGQHVDLVFVVGIAVWQAERWGDGK